MTWQASPRIYPDIEAWATAYLRAAITSGWAATFPGLYVSNSVPSPRRDFMVIVRRDGGTEDGLLDRPRVSARVWGDTEQSATDLARIVKALFNAAADGDPVVYVPKRSSTGPYPVADESGQPMRYLSVELHVRGDELAL